MCVRVCVCVYVCVCQVTSHSLPLVSFVMDDESQET